MDGIKSFLIDYLKKKIELIKKKTFKNPFISFGHTDETILFRTVLNKESYTLTNFIF